LPRVFLIWSRSNVKGGDFMAVANPYDKYKNQAVFTASKEDLTLMLYEGALKFCNQAIAATESKDYPKANELIQKVEAIIREFQLTLNRSYDISKNLDALYAYIHERLVEANMRKDTEVLSEIRDLLRDFRDMWKEAIRASRQSAAQ
jgi:flagellar protein FliS